jgi:hypothetical protein
MARTERARSVLALLACAGALALAAPQDRPADKPLVRKDLLVFGRAETTPTLRDIFRPAPAAPGAVPVRIRPALRPDAAAPSAEALPSFNLNISYIGSVKSGGQMLALILRGGQTESVRQGDEITPGYKVVSLTTEAIVVQGPTGETRTFQKQGDRP